MADDLVRVRIAPSVQRDYSARAVFPDLRLDSRYEADGAITYRVPRTVAMEVLVDARAQYARKYTLVDRGVKKAYYELTCVLPRTLHTEQCAPAQPDDEEIDARWQSFVDDTIRGYRDLDGAARTRFAVRMRDPSWLPKITPLVRRRILEGLIDVDEIHAEVRYRPRAYKEATALMRRLGRAGQD